MVMMMMGVRVVQVVQVQMKMGSRLLLSSGDSTAEAKVSLSRIPASCAAGRFGATGPKAEKPCRGAYVGVHVCKLHAGIERRRQK